MEWVEVTGRSVEEAKEAALDQLGVDAQEAEFEVLEEPRGGLLGRLRSEARVRARVLPTAPRPKLDRRDRRDRRPGRDRGQASTAPAPRTAPAPNTASRPAPQKENVMSEPPSLDEEAEAAKEFLVGLLDALDADATVSSRIVEDETIEVAEQVRATGTATLLEPMTPPDRKIVHDTVNGIEGVSTSSEGEEPYRRVAITPDATS